MSAIDWASDTVEAFATQPPHRAVNESVESFVSGLVGRISYAKHRISPTPTYSTTLLGHDMTFMATSVEDIKRADMLNGELPIAEWLSRGVDDGTVFWDVGAYHGHYSALMAEFGAHVIAFEPGENNIPRVRMNGALNEHSIPVYNVALSSTGGERVFGGPKESENAVGRLGCELKGERGADSVCKPEGATMVPVRRGEGIEPAPEVMKIDVEGHEVPVLNGLGEHLNDVDRVVIEVHHNDDVGRVKTKLWDAGLQTVELDSTRSQTYIGGKR